LLAFATKWGMSPRVSQKLARPKIIFLPAYSL
jgi:hypothetical protein